jgi:hypothetical protein
MKWHRSGTGSDFEAVNYLFIFVFLRKLKMKWWGKGIIVALKNKEGKSTLSYFVRCAGLGFRTIHVSCYAHVVMDR